MSSKVQICNLALARLGAARITSLTDNTESANLCNLLFNDIAEEVMMEGAWTSTLVRTDLAQTTNTPSYDYTYEYQLPVNPKCLKVLAVNDLVQGDIDYRIEGDKLLCNDSTIKILYISYLTDTEAYGTALKTAIVSRLAMELAYPITGNASLVDALMRRYERDLNIGLSNSTSQGSNEGIDTNDLTEVR